MVNLHHSIDFKVEELNGENSKEIVEYIIRNTAAEY